MNQPLSRTQKAEALKAALASKMLAHSPQLCSILRYVCEREIEGRAGEITEYTIGVEVLHRPEGYSSVEDPSVRKRAYELRQKLNLLYTTELARAAVKIEIPKGSYVPVFRAEASPVPESIAPQPEPADQPQPEPDQSTPPREIERVVPWRRIALVLIPVLLIVAGGSWYALSRMNRDRTPPRQAAAAAPNGALGKEQQALLIRTGVQATNYADPRAHILCPDRTLGCSGAQVSPFVDRLGRRWGLDQFFNGGTAVARPSVPVYGTVDPALYQSAREGSFRYDIPVPQAVYELHLHFAETFWGYQTSSDSDGVGFRGFIVTVNEAPLLPGLDIVSDAGAPNLADERVFTDISPASDGFIHLAFTGLFGGASVSGIELRPGIAGRMAPVRIAAGGESYVDGEGNTWGPDRYFLGGRSQKHPAVTVGTTDPVLYSAERWGNFQYIIPVARGVYQVKLRFSERHWGQSNAGGGGVGSRLFDVYANGVALLRNFDIIKEAGGENRATDKVFRNIPASAQGKIRLWFLPGNTYATVNAIEVTPER